MDLLEYQGKQLFARHGVPVPKGAPATTVEQALAQVNLVSGGATAPDAAKQYLGYLQQFVPVVDRQVKTFCKGSSRRSQ